MFHRPAIYLDHNATTPMLPEVEDEMRHVAASAWANPGSRHQEGRKARQVLETARERLAGCLGARPSEVLFTSGGTEANNLALHGLCGSHSRSVALLPGEHPSLEGPAARLTQLGWQRATLPIDADGLLRRDDLEKLPWHEIGLVGIALAHSETGVIRSLDQLNSLCRTSNIPLHVDAVQAAGKLDFRFSQLGCTSLALAAHKFGGPRGVGALLVCEDARLTPLMAGGLQERERRPGTESVLLVAGMAKALELWDRDRASRSAHLLALRNQLESGLRAACPQIVIHGEGTDRLPNTSNIAFPGCDGEALMVALDLAGICCSLGTACSSGATEPAPILVAMGCPPDIQRSSVRFSLGLGNTTEEIEQGVRIIAEIVKGLRDSARALESSL